MKTQVWENFSFIDDFRSNYYYNKILIRDDKTIPAALTRNINSFGGQYEYQKTNGKEIFSVQIRISLYLILMLS
jgi:hypothetical protein